MTSLLGQLDRTTNLNLKENRPPNPNDVDGLFSLNNRSLLDRGLTSPLRGSAARKLPMREQPKAAMCHYNGPSVKAQASSALHIAGVQAGFCRSDTRRSDRPLPFDVRCPLTGSGPSCPIVRHWGAELSSRGLDGASALRPLIGHSGRKSECPKAVLRSERVRVESLPQKALQAAVITEALPRGEAQRSILRQSGDPLPPFLGCSASGTTGPRPGENFARERGSTGSIPGQARLRPVPRSKLYHQAKARGRPAQANDRSGIWAVAPR